MFSTVKLGCQVICGQNQVRLTFFLLAEVMLGISQDIVLVQMASDSRVDYGLYHLATNGGE